MDYRPARSLEPIELGRTDCPLVSLRSHPNFPNTLSPELEGTWIGTNPSWPEATVDSTLDTLDPPCHTDWDDYDEKRTEKRGKLEAFVIYVRPGPVPSPLKVA